jgi:cysteinyl-tRNA synthetase
MIQIYNGLTRKKEELVTLSPNIVKMYVCGITVYDKCHMGHARTSVAFDVIVRYLRSQGYHVSYVRNITDIDDKIINRAKELSTDTHSLVEKYIEKMHNDFDALNILRPDHEPRATESIEEIIQIITLLINNKCAYVGNNGDVYFRVSSFDKYGELSGQELDHLKSGIRVAISDHKEDPLDFVLWKSTKPGEPSWDSPWSIGRPGWHIECSAMAKKILGNTFDIHGGGSDLRFPHHENEIAQSESANSCSYASYWMHSGMVKINSEKMSKSLNNFFTIEEVLNNYSAEVIRYFLISGHYRSELNYSQENLDNAYQALERLYSSLRGVNIKVNSDPSEERASYLESFKGAMNNDFNTPEAISVLFAISKKINKAKSINNTEESELFAGLLIELGAVLGILQKNAEDFFKTDNLDSDLEIIENLIEKRIIAKQDKRWSEADNIREELKNMGVALEDTQDGTTWKRNC